jgi:peptidoglycan hydrolase-like protein with peptidoglycan-binding domain
MKFGVLLLTSSLIAATACPCLAATHPRRGPTSAKLLSKHTKTKKIAGQRTIDNERATQIQAALIKSGYLPGEPSGHWDTQTEAAMQKYQSDNGWQTKLTPDSRAIIKLGLGPSQDTEVSTGFSSTFNAPESPAVSALMQR